MSEFTWDGVNPPEVYVDMLGQEIREGDYILYSVVYGSSASLVLGVLEKFLTADPRGKPYQGYNWKTQTHDQHYFKMHVQPLLRHGYRQGLEHRKVYLADNSCVVRADVSRATLPEHE